MKTGLAALINSSAEFQKAFKENRPFVVHNNFENLKPLTSLPFLNSLDDLLNSWPMPIQAHLPDVRDEASSIDTTNKDARKLFDNGMGLLFNEAHLISPVLTDWLEEIRQNLGLPMMTIGRCLMYATPDGKGTAPHFDQNINFVIQVHGTKKWILAPNETVENPLTRHTMGLEPDPELASYLEAPMPTKMPHETMSFELKPGSVLFVPRGVWHETEADGNALSLNFTYTAPSWIDLFSTALRGRLAQSPEWRAMAQKSEVELDALLDMIKADLPHWRARDVLEATFGE
ncbi:JmjC domain-containing protein [Peredibacter starrii]|uniref:Cupin domain-containing protein n=1 Tax=Peredibacter starrii TaxID=28202 RepID=A0AAX4HKB3_9BACT|nr:cupin domain-containing protein [Peredibacter starrii]WPU63590.1 cupin domain-containing protein [Peredibacter starrii]